ncbi:fluoride efflux transporter FluC [Caldalkalibacillus thermarum]|uniref:fluoride efflux transporter FluC n=1 Tax=Caldalkalibacillus thermarum TaxID=296745 RepID=UPI0016641EE6|nr:CrcB family protein [Caldalkalibacillus thermarum]
MPQLSFYYSQQERAFHHRRGKKNDVREVRKDGHRKIIGAFTTFSTFKLESVNLFRRGEGKTSLLYMRMTYLLGIGAAWLGYLIHMLLFTL